MIMYGYSEINEDIFVFFQEIGEKITLLSFFLQTSKRQYDDRFNSRVKELMESKGKEEKEILKRYEEEIQNGTEPSLASYVSGLDYFESQYALSEIEEYEDKSFLIDTLCKSTLINTYGLVEFVLKKICELLRKRHNYRIKYKHFEKSYDYINSSKDYLDLVCELEVYSLEHYFTELKNLQQLRNRLVHSLGTIDDEDQNKNKAVLKIIKSKDGITLNREFNQIEISDIEFVLDYLNLVRDFFTHLSFLIERKNGFVNLKKGLDNILIRTPDAEFISSEVYSSENLKVKYKVFFAMKGMKTDVTFYFYTGEKADFEIYQQSQHKKLSVAINKFEIYFKKALEPYLSLGANRIGVKVYV